MSLTFKSPWILLLIPFVVGSVIWWYGRKKETALQFSSSLLLVPVAGGLKAWLSAHLYWGRAFALIFFMVALAGPQQVLEETPYKAEGVDIVLAIDASGSMAAEDFKVDGQRVNRLTAVKHIVRDFIRKRSNDRIGLVVFSQFAYTVCPLTFDQEWLLDNLDRVQLGMMEDGTAIGSALASSTARLKASSAKSRIVILLTDGINNAGKIAPVAAANIAEAMGIRVYTIGAGSKGPVPFPIQDFWGRRAYQNVEINIDDATLQEIATLTGGKYFWAKDTETLKAIYAEIDQMEKSAMQQNGYREYRQLFPAVLIVALLMLFIDLVLSNTWLVKIP